jgi:uncharacterized protein GlcG (DUF336 family)
MRPKHSLTAADGHKLMQACKAEAQKQQWNVSIAIVDEGGYLLHMERMDGAPLPSPTVALGKARASALLRTPTKAQEDAIKDRPALLNFPDRIPVQGGVPLMYQGECVGAIGVSGVKSPEDEQVAMAGAAALV